MRAVAVAALADEIRLVLGVEVLVQAIRKVQKVFGPGNAYVVAAKRLVVGHVAIDLLPGPSEVLVLADDTLAAARHAAENGWIDELELEEVAAEGRADPRTSRSRSLPTMHARCRAPASARRPPRAGVGRAWSPQTVQNPAGAPAPPLRGRRRGPASPGR